MKFSVCSCLIYVAVLIAWMNPSVQAQSSGPLPASAPLDLNRLRLDETQAPSPGICPTPPTVITSKTICQSSLTNPSLWWAKEQFGGQLLENWLAYDSDRPELKRVDLVVNAQAWSLLDYLERYEFINKFGEIAQSYGYDTRLFNRQGELLAAYTCHATTISNSSKVLPNCAIQLDSSKRNGLRTRSSSLTP